MDNPLTTPITTTVTQYRLSAITLDAENQIVTVSVSLLDAGGIVQKSVSLRETMATMAIPAGLVTSLRQAVVAYLKGNGTIN